MRADAWSLPADPSLGNFVTAGATALWSDWGDRMTASGVYYSGGGRCASGCSESFSAAWLSLAVKYYYTVWAGILQHEDSAGYEKPILAPNIPWADATTGLSYGGPSRSLEYVRASMQTPHGRIASAWARHRAGAGNDGPSVSFEFVIANGTLATVTLPIAIPASDINVTVVTTSAGSTTEEAVVYSSHQAAHGSGERRFGSSNLTVVGSYAAISLSAVPPGHHRFKLQGSKPAVAVCTSTGTELPPSSPLDGKAKLRCPSGSIMLSIEQAAFGKVTPPMTCGAARATVGCSAGSSRYHIERLCLGKAACDLSAVDAAVFDPVGQLPGNCKEGLGWAGDNPTLFAQALCGAV